MSEKFQGKYRIPSARLQGYNYGQNGAYFITICTKHRSHYFGKIISQPGGGVETQYIASLHATPIGLVAIEYWEKIPEHFPFVVLDEYRVMPNHIHGIIILSKPIVDRVVETHNDASLQDEPYKNKFGPQSGNISSVIRGYKAAVKSFATIHEIDFGWQPRFHDRIIRDKDELRRIRKYIAENPENWEKDKDNNESLYM